MERESNNILLSGVPRSGSTWLSEVLCFQGIARVHEPDNEMNSILGLIFKKGMHRFPFLKANDECDPLFKLYDLTFNHKIIESGTLCSQVFFGLYNKSKEKIQMNLVNHGTGLTKDLPFSNMIYRWCKKSKINDSRILVKSVHNLLYLPFLIENFNFKLIIIQRNPLNVFSSYRMLNMPDSDRALYENESLLNYLHISKPDNIDKLSQGYKSGFQQGLFTNVLEKYKADPAFVNAQFIDYEKTIENPFSEIRNICSNLEIDYNSELENFIAGKFKAGKGFQTNRDVTNYEQIWKKRLKSDQVEAFLEGYQAANGKVDFKV